MKNTFKYTVLYFAFFINITFAESNSNDDKKPNETAIISDAYCFRFTWLGPKYNKESLTEFQNVTCDDLDLSKKDPCRLPLVVTDNAASPDTNWLWKKKVAEGKYKEIACRLATSDVCAKITFKYNHQIENITYMCTKVSIDGEGAAPNDCYKTDHGNGRQTEVCVCESSAGKIPCNSSTELILQNVNTFILILLNILIIILTGTFCIVS